MTSSAANPAATATEQLSPAARALVEAHLPLVRSVVAGVAAHYPRHADREELVQAGTLGLVEAAHRFDASRGVPFERWAALRVRGAVVDAVRALEPASRTTRSAALEITVVRTALEGERGRAPTTGEVADRAGCSIAELSLLDARVHRGVVLSLDADNGNGDEEGASLAASLVDEPSRRPDRVLEQRERSRYLEDAVACLPDRLQDVITSYYLTGETSALLAARLGITESRVSQLRSGALTLMRTGLLAAGAAGPETAPAAVAVPGARQATYASALARRSSFGERLSARPAAVHGVLPA